MELKIAFLFMFALCFVACNSDNEENRNYISDLPTQHYLNGLKYGVQGKFNLAKNEFEAELKKNPANQSTESRLRVINDVTNGKIKTETAIHIFKCMEFVNKNKIEDAINELNIALTIDENYDELYRLRGRSYRELKKYDKAIEDYNTAIKINPNNTGAIMNRANAYSSMGNYTRALEEVNTLIENDPKDVILRFNRGSIFAKLENHGKAIDDYNSALKLDSTFSPAYFNKAISLESLYKLFEALENYKKIIEIAPYGYQDLIKHAEHRISAIEMKLN